MTRSTKATNRIDTNLEITSLPGSPLTESNRRPSPYHPGFPRFTAQHRARRASSSRRPGPYRDLRPTGKTCRLRETARVSPGPANGGIMGIRHAIQAQSVRLSPARPRPGRRSDDGQTILLPRMARPEMPCRADASAGSCAYSAIPGRRPKAPRCSRPAPSCAPPPPAAAWLVMPARPPRCRTSRRSGRRSSASGPRAALTIPPWAASKILVRAQWCCPTAASPPPPGWAPRSVCLGGNGNAPDLQADPDCGRGGGSASSGLVKASFGARRRHKDPGPARPLSAPTAGDHQSTLGRTQQRLCRKPACTGTFVPCPRQLGPGRFENEHPYGQPAMSRVVVLGAGISGHTAAAFARKWLGRGDTVTVVSPERDYNWIPSNIWVGVGLMKPAQVTFPLAPVYERARHRVQAGARRARSTPRATPRARRPTSVDRGGRHGQRARGPLRLPDQRHRARS